MMKMEHLFENLDIAKRWIEHWEHDAKSLPDMLPYFRISANAVHPFKYNDEVRYLRYAPLSEKNPADVHFEINLLNHLLDQGIAVNQPLKSKEGSYVLNDDQHVAVCFMKAPGDRLDRIDLTPKIAFRAGRLLKDIHVASRRFEHEALKPDLFGVLEWCKAEVKDAWYHKAIHQIETDLKQQPMNEDTFGLIHYDFETDNLFYDDAVDRVTAIDFDDCMYNFYALDVQKALNSLTEEITDDTIHSAIKNAFLEGYGSLPTDPDTTRLFQHFIDALSYAKMHYSLDSKVDIEPDWMMDLREKFTANMARLEQRLRAIKTNE